MLARRLDAKTFAADSSGDEPSDHAKDVTLAIAKEDGMAAAERPLLIKKGVYLAGRVFPRPLTNRFRPLR